MEYIENCLSIVCDRANQLIDEEKSLEAFSVSLGEICHYVSDFFCYYHLNEEIHNKKLQHFLYELRLHLELSRIQFKRRYKILPSTMEPRKDISSIILDMREAYFSQPQSIRRDIDYAFSSAVWTCESVINFMNYSYQLTKEAEQALYSFMIAEGGSL